MEKEETFGKAREEQRIQESSGHRWTGAKSSGGQRTLLIYMQMVLFMVHSSEEQRLLGLCPWAVSGVAEASQTDLF